MIKWAMERDNINNCKHKNHSHQSSCEQFMTTEVPWAKRSFKANSQNDEADQKLEIITLELLWPGKLCVFGNSGKLRGVCSRPMAQSQQGVWWIERTVSVQLPDTPHRRYRCLLNSIVCEVDRHTTSATGECTRYYANKLKLMDENWLLRVWRTKLILVLSCRDDNNVIAFVWAKYGILHDWN